MPAAVAIPLVSALAPATASVATGLYGAHKVASSNEKAARLQTNAANHAADIEAQSAREALAFQKQQADLDQQRFETTQRANYDQWAAREGRLSSLGALVGLPSRNIPGYQSSLPGGNSGPAPDLSGVQAKFNALFPGETLTPDMLAAHRPELEAMGFTLNPNARGQITDLSYGGVNIDPIQGAGSGLNRKQWLVGGGGAAPAPPRPSYTTSASSLMPPPAYQPNLVRTAPLSYQPLGRLSDLV